MTPPWYERQHESHSPGNFPIICESVFSTYSRMENVKMPYPKSLLISICTVLMNDHRNFVSSRHSVSEGQSLVNCEHNTRNQHLRIAKICYELQHWHLIQILCLFSTRSILHKVHWTNTMYSIVCDDPQLSCSKGNFSRTVSAGSNCQDRVSLVEPHYGYKSAPTLLKIYLNHPKYSIM